MKRLLITCLFLVAPVVARAGLMVFTCEPEWASLAERLGGELVEVSSATHALQDPHYIQARPSLISRVRGADLLICTGADLEIGWLPKLLGKSNNPKVQPGKPGYFEASAFVRRLDVPAVVDRARGDMHPLGNPHVQTNPNNISLIAEALGLRLGVLDPDNADTYRRNTARFLQEWNAAVADWEERARPLRGLRVIAHHKSWVYLHDWLGLEEVATLEPVPGVPPTASHLGLLLDKLGSDGRGANVIIRAPYQSDKASSWLSDRTGIPAVMLPLSVGGSDKASDLFGMFDDILYRLLETRGR